MNSQTTYLLIPAAAGLLALSLSAGAARADVGPLWCTHDGASRVDVDLNSDRVPDAFCHDANGAKWAAIRRPGVAGNAGLDQIWFDFTGWCSHADARLLVGDANGDGRADLICKDPSSTWLNFSRGVISYPGTDTRFENRWCTHAGTSTNVADQNRDGRADLICRGGDGWVWVDWSNGDWQPYDGLSDIGRQSPDFLITGVTSHFGLTRITIRNDGSAGRIQRLGCNTVERFENIPLAAGRTVIIEMRASVGGPPINCRVHGVGEDGLPEVVDWNNEFTRR